MNTTILKNVYVIFISLLIFMSNTASSAELNNFSWYQTSLGAGDTNSEFKFNYDIATEAPNIIFDAKSNGIDTSSLGQPFDASTVSVTINSVPAEINFSDSYNYGNGLYIRLVDPSLAASGDSVEVILQDVKNHTTPGNYPWSWIRTSQGNVEALDQVTDPREIELWGYELNNFSWKNTNSEGGATDVSYEFSYELISSSPNMIFYGYVRGFWENDEYQYPIDFSGGDQVLDDSKVRVTINGVAADISFGESWIFEGNIYIRLVDASLAQAGDTVVVTVYGVSHKEYFGTHDWEFLGTAHPSGQAMDLVSDPEPIVLTSTSSTEFNNFSWYQPSLGAGDTNSEFKFNYDIVTEAPNIIFDAKSNGIDTSSLGQPFDASTVSVTINGVPAEINFSDSYNYGNGLYIRLVDPSLAASGDSVEVILQNVINHSTPGNYSWSWIRTSQGNGEALDQVTNPRKIELWGYELNNFSWKNTNSEGGATNVSYEFSYELFSSSPNMIFYGHMRGFWEKDEYQYPVDFSGGGQVLDDSKVSVTINGVAADINFGWSWISEGSIGIRLAEPSLAQAGDMVVVTVNEVTHGEYIGTHDWLFIQTAHPSGQAMDQVSDPAPLVLTPVLVVDTDNDGISDVDDNCINHFNPNQFDGDGDGFGNRCDADLNNDGVLDSIDSNLMRTMMVEQYPAADLSEDSRFNGDDIMVFRELWNEQ